MNNVLKYYLYANRLKEKVRTGWIEIGINKERLESVAEHIYGCLMLAIALDSEYSLDLDMNKVLKMIMLHETEEILLGDLTLRSGITKEEKDRLGREKVFDVTKGLLKQDEIVSIIDEFNERKTKEAIFSYHIDKIECDFQAKIYDLEGVFSITSAKEDLKYYGNRAKEVEDESKCASDYWIIYDKPKYDDDIIFKNLINEIQKLDALF